MTRSLVDDLVHDINASNAQGGTFVAKTKPL